MENRATRTILASARPQKSTSIYKNVPYFSFGCIHMRVLCISNMPGLITKPLASSLDRSHRHWLHTLGVQHMHTNTRTQSLSVRFRTPRMLKWHERAHISTRIYKNSAQKIEARQTMLEWVRERKQEIESKPRIKKKSKNERAWKKFSLCKDDCTMHTNKNGKQQNICQWINIIFISSVW